MNFTDPAPISIVSMTINLLLGLLLSGSLAVYYARFGDTLSNRSKFAPILPILTLITLLVISVVKSSLALSLGLVGALSIVRFRTAIKDPEELIFLFFAIAIGLGMGADQRIPTILAFTIIMVFLFARKLYTRAFRIKTSNSLYLNINLPFNTTPEKVFSEINDILSEELRSVDLRRLDTNPEKMQFVYYFKTRNPESLPRICGHIQEKYENASISIVEQNNILGG